MSLTKWVCDQSLKTSPLSSFTILIFLLSTSCALRLRIWLLVTYHLSFRQGELLLPLFRASLQEYLMGMASAADRSVVSSFVAAKLVSTVLLFEVWDAIKRHLKKREFKSLDPNPNPSFECCLWPIEQVWLLGLLALFLFFFPQFILTWMIGSIYI